jgi:hypothetical protein
MRDPNPPPGPGPDLAVSAGTARHVLYRPLTGTGRRAEDPDLHARLPVPAVHAVEEALRQRLEDVHFEGPDYEWVAFLLARFGQAFILRGVRSRALFTACAKIGRPVGPASAVTSQSDCEELAVNTIPPALALFRDKGLIMRGWQPDEQTLGCYFRGSCIRVFPNVFRTWHHQHRPADPNDIHYLSQLPDRAGDPADQVLLRLSAAEALRQVVDPVEQGIVALASEGFTHAEIADLLAGGLTASAVKRRLAAIQRCARARRFRTEGP